MLRIWCEHLDYEDARQPRVLDLLERGGLNPIFAVHIDADLNQLAALLGDVQARGLHPGIWPLLSDHDGYWPSIVNGAAFFDRVERVLDHLDGAGVQPAWTAVDLEPPLEETRALYNNSPAALLRTIWNREDSSRFRSAVALYTDGARRLADRGVRTLGITASIAAADLRDGVPRWQHAFKIPWADVAWDRTGIMAYGSLTVGKLYGLLNEEDVRALHYRLFSTLVDAYGPAAHASLGLTGTGKLEDEAVYQRPEDLAADIAAAHAAGISDIAIFCLEGLIARDDAERWVDVMAAAGSYRPPMTWRASAALSAAGAIRRLTGRRITQTA